MTVFNRTMYWGGMAAIGTAFFLLVLGIVYAVPPLYFRLAPVDTFFVLDRFTAHDVCYGHDAQAIESVRHIYALKESGIPATATRELFRVDGVSNVKVFEDIASIVIEDASGVSYREQQIPALKRGTYIWNISVELRLPYNITRVDVPRIISNTFEVKDCI